MEKAAQPTAPPAVQTWQQPQQPPYPTQPPPPAQPTHHHHKKSARERFNCSDGFLILVAFFLPPFAVWLKRGCGGDLLVNLLLDFLGWIPGVVHAWYIILSTP